MLQIKDIYKEYKTGSLVQKALDGVTLSFREHEFVAILGPSGSGKTTLLNIIGGLDHCDRGEITIDGVPTEKYSGRDWDAYRNHSVGFIFQSYNLIPHQTLLSNVELAMTLAGVSKAQRRERAAEELEKVGLREQMHKKPAQLSGGQMQRVAIARALVNDPSIVLADEPTGALDSDTGEQVMKLLKEVSDSHLVIMVTHNPDLARRYATRIIQLRDGKITSDSDPYPAEAVYQAAGSQAETGGGQITATGSETEGKPSQLTEAGAGHNCQGRTHRQRRPSMSFGTALSLSVSNLLSKKARTVLVAFAVSIGITGIALILSLSSGAHSYIYRMEAEALSEYPLQIASTSYSMDSTMQSMSRMTMGSLSGGGDDDNAETELTQVSEQQFLSTLISGASTNDLKSLKRWFDSGYSGIEDLTRLVSYGYGISPQIYLHEDDGYRQVNPDQTMSAMGLSMDDNLTGMMSSWNSNDVFFMLPENEDLYKDSYTVVAGSWPEKDTDCVLVLTSSGEVMDYLLYTMGLKDEDELNEKINDMLTGQAVDTSLDEASQYSPEDFLGIKFKVLPACRRFSYDEDMGVWLDCADDTETMTGLLDDARELEITGVVMPQSGSSIGLLQYGIDYTPRLMEELIDEAADSDVVKAQMSDPDMDILTGSPFDSEDDMSSLNIMDMVDVDASKLPDAISVDWDALPEVLDEYGQLSAVQTVHIIRELSRTGESPTLKSVIEDMIPALSELLKIDDEKLQEAITIDMNDERMQELYAARSSSDSSSYAGNLLRFGYADPESPSMITIYPNDFESKQAVTELLDAYNRTMEDEGYEDKVITYTDYVGSLMSSVTTIIDVITYVLVAFVAVSLVVSSIMIGIITYISVLERRKEIGILRAMGASRHNISEVFNAETFIIGLLAGAFGIAMTLLLIIPVNAAIHAYTDQPVYAYLPAGAGAMLVALCVLLTLIGGLIPARKASRQDPVAALRSE